MLRGVSLLHDVELCRRQSYIYVFMVSLNIFLPFNLCFWLSKQVFKAFCSNLTDVITFSVLSKTLNCLKYYLLFLGYIILMTFSCLNSQNLFISFNMSFSKYLLSTQQVSDNLVSEENRTVNKDKIQKHSFSKSSTDRDKKSQFRHSEENRKLSSSMCVGGGEGHFQQILSLI